MNFSYEGIGQWAASFGCADVKEGMPVKMAEAKTVGKCADGDSFCGVAVSVAKDGKACAVALGGMVTVAFTGGAPALGWTGLSAGGEDCVKADETGRSYLVVDVDEAAGMVTFVL